MWPIITTALSIKHIIILALMCFPDAIPPRITKRSGKTALAIFLVMPSRLGVGSRISSLISIKIIITNRIVYCYSSSLISSSSGGALGTTVTGTAEA